jgi:hypothetical protein
MLVAQRGIRRTCDRKKIVKQTRRYSYLLGFIQLFIWLELPPRAHMPTEQEALPLHYWYYTDQLPMAILLVCSDGKLLISRAIRNLTCYKFFRS